MSDRVNPSSAQRRQSRGGATRLHYLIHLLAVISTRLAAWVAMRIWQKTRRYPVPDRETVWLRDSNSEFIRVGKRRIRLRRWGAENNRPVLLVHGWGGRGSQMGAFARPLVERGYSVLAPDLPGHGESDGSSTDFVECSRVLHTIEQLNGAFAGIIAHSFGAVVCTYGLCDGLSADACVLVGAPHSGEKIFASYINWLAPPQSVAAQMLKNLQRDFGHDVLGSMSPGEQAHNLHTPCLILHDRQDREVSVDSARYLAKNWRGAKLVCTRGLGHRRILRDAKCVQLAAEFVAERDPSLSRSQSRHSTNSDS